MVVQQERWVTFDEIAVTIDEEEEEEKLSLSDLPMISDDKDGHIKEEKERDEDNAAEAADDFDFEFLSKDDEMCAADDVFSGGQMLPLRPSVSSECGLLPPSRSGSASESMERCSSAAWSTSASSSRSSRSSACGISRSPSSSSFSNNFYAHPSPTPRVRRAAGSGGGRRRSTGSPPPGWSLLRLGVAKAPEIELGDLRSRRGSGRKAAGAAAQPPPPPQKEAKKEMTVVMRLLGGGFGCKCSPDAVVEESLRKKEMPLKRGESSCCRSRIFEWLDDLSAGKASSASTE